MPDLQPVRRDIFDILQMFGPANAGGPPQANTNPGTREQPQPDLSAVPPPTPQPQQQAPGGELAPVGVRPLPQGTPITPNAAPAAPAGAAAAGADARQQAIELLPSDADPNMLPPELRDSPLFRYMQAQRVAQFKQAQQEAQWSNVVGGVGNIAQILSGQQPSYQQAAAHAKAPGALGLDDLRNLSGDISKAQSAAAQKAEVARLLPEVAKQTGIPIEQLQLMGVTKPEDINDIIKNRATIADSEKERQRINADRKSQGRPEIGAEAWHRQGIGEDIMKAEATSAGGEKVKLAGEDIKTAKASNAALEQTLVRNAAARSAIESGAGITGGGFSETEVETKAREIGAKFGLDRGAVSNDRVVMALLSKNAIDMSIDMKGSLSDKDIAMLNKAAAGDPNLSAEEKSRIIAINDLATRRKIDQNNDNLTRAGTQLGQDRSKESSRPNPMTAAELREIDPNIAREIIRNPEQGRRLAEFRYGKTVSDELVQRAEEVITSRLYEQRPIDSKLKSQASQARTQLNKDADTFLRGASVDEVEADRDRVIQQLDAMDPSGNGAATYELIIDAKRAGRYGVKP